MDYKNILKELEKEIGEDMELFGDALGLVYQSYSTYAIATKLTEEFYKITNLMSSEDATENRIKRALIDIAKICINSAVLMTLEEEEEEIEEAPKKRTIGFRVADKEDGYKEDDTPNYPIDTYAIGYETYDEEDYYDGGEDWW